MTLTQDNYRSAEAQREYMSVHQYREYCACPARAHAMLTGKWQEPQREAYLVGHYVEMGIMDTDAQYRLCGEYHDAICQRNGQPRAAFVAADAMIDRVRRDDLAMAVLTGPGTERQVILTGEVDGVAWKGMADVIHPTARVVVDFKTARDFAPGWATIQAAGGESRAQVPWYCVYDYVAQLGIYRMLCEQAYGGEWLPLIVAVTKQTPPDIGCWSCEDRDRVDAHIAQFLANMGQICAYKSGSVVAPGCGRNDCDYCRAHRQLAVLPAQW